MNKSELKKEFYKLSDYTDKQGIFIPTWLIDNYLSTIKEPKTSIADIDIKHDKGIDEKFKCGSDEDCPICN